MSLKKRSKKTPKKSTVKKPMKKPIKLMKTWVEVGKEIRSIGKRAAEIRSEAAVGNDTNQAMTPLPDDRPKVRVVAMHKAYLTEHPQDKTQPTFVVVIAYTAEHALKKLTRAFPFQRVTSLHTDEGNQLPPSGIRAIVTPALTLVE